MEWISTRIKEPITDGSYLVRFYSVSKLNPIPRYETREAKFREGKWFTIGHYFSWDVLSKGKVTHWMNLPEDPVDWCDYQAPEE